MPRAQALVVDADPGVRAVVRSVLQHHDVDISETGSSADAGHRLRERRVDLLVLDLGDPALIGLEGDRAAPPVTVGLGSGAERAAVFETVPKPLSSSTLAVAVGRALDHATALAEIRRLRTMLRAGDEQLVGVSPAVEHVRNEIERLVANRQPLWLVGETGTGKALTARLLHDRSRHAEQPFVTAHAGTMEAADWERLLEQAGGGTLYVEAASLLPGDVQRKAAAGPPDGLRLICSSTESPRELERQGALLPECRRRLAATILDLPPLRDRSEDVPLLARHFVRTIADLNRLTPIDLDAGALDRLRRHRWPGNVQELRNAIEHAVILAADGSIRAQDLPDSVGSGVAPAAQSATQRDLASREFREVKREIVSEFEKRYLHQLLERFDGNVTVAARHSGMLRSALQRLLRKHDLKSVEYRGGRRATADRPAESRARPD